MHTPLLRLIPRLAAAAVLALLVSPAWGQGGFRRFPATTSPDGAYVLAWGVRENREERLADLEEERGEEEGRLTADDDQENFLADARTGRLLAVIPGFRYFSGPTGRQNHFDLQVAWSPDVQGALAIYDARWSYAAIAWIDPAARQFTDLGKPMEDAFRRLLARREKRKDAGEVSFRNPVIPEPGILLVEGWAQVPKSLKDPVFHYRLKYRVAAKHGQAQVELSKATPFSEDDQRQEETGLGPAEAVEAALNKVYNQWRAKLGDAGRAALKQEQLRWLRTRESITEETARQEFTVQRLRELRARLAGW